MEVLVSAESSCSNISFFVQSFFLREMDIILALFCCFSPDHLLSGLAAQFSFQNLLLAEF